MINHFFRSVLDRQGFKVLGTIFWCKAHVLEFFSCRLPRPGRESPAVEGSAEKCGKCGRAVLHGLRGWHAVLPVWWFCQLPNRACRPQSVVSGVGARAGSALQVKGVDDACGRSQEGTVSQHSLTHFSAVGVVRLARWKHRTIVWGFGLCESVAGVVDIAVYAISTISNLQLIDSSTHATHSSIRAPFLSEQARQHVPKIAEGILQLVYFEYPPPHRFGSFWGWDGLGTSGTLWGGIWVMGEEQTGQRKELRLTTTNPTPRVRKKTTDRASGWHFSFPLRFYSLPESPFHTLRP